MKLVMIDKGMLDQVLMNLVVNSRDALGDEGGSITVRVDVERIEDEGFLDCHKVEPGEFCRIQIVDDGCGMSRQIAERAFEPFYTTKSEGKGSGLGLSMVYGIAQRHGGFVTLESEPGFGTQVSVYFPLTDESAEVGLGSADSSSLPAPTGNDDTILVVEDNELVRSLMTRELTRAGYRVLTAGDGLEAVSVYDDAAGDIALILTDLSMPRMGGVELIRTIRQKNPAAKALVVTGYNDSSGLKGSGLLEGVPVLKKPYLREELLTLVNQLLRS
jgi:CheY-like chemotaxis protein